MFTTAVRHLGIQPSEFWDMTLSEFLVLVSDAAEDVPGQFAGKLRQSDVDELTEWMGSKEYKK